MSSFHTRSSLPVAPTAAPARSRQPQVQVQRAHHLAANYWTSAAWRSSYEWRRDDERAAAAAAAAGREPPAAVAPHYMWQDTATARAFLKANRQLEETKEAMAHDGQMQQPKQQPLSRDCLDDLSATAAAGASRRVDDGPTAALMIASRTPFDASQVVASATGAQPQQQPSASGASAHPSRPAAATNTLAGFPFSTRSHAAVPAPIGASPSHRPRSTANFPLRGAGALPTHRATTGASRSRLAAGAPAQADLDWSGWGRAVQRALHPKQTKDGQQLASLM